MGQKMMFYRVVVKYRMRGLEVRKGIDKRQHRSTYAN
jgi:hypothetical protein